jgi:putative PIN family toxin of toxin-antitoxin system
MPLTPELVAAYMNALYAVKDGPVLRIGEANATLERLLEAHGARSAAFVTAANPRGAQASAAQNDAAMASLAAALSWPALAGEGRDPQGRWRAEPSLLVLGIARAEAEALGRRFAQNAIVYCERGGAPELVLLRKMRLVLDTQVWLDWLIFGDDSVSGLRATIEAGHAELVIDDACFAELERVLAYPLGRRSVDAVACLSACRTWTTRVEAGSGEALYDLPQCRDPDDQKFLTLAARAAADCLVTRDRELLRLSRRCATRFQIVRPSAFVNFLAPTHALRQAGR